MKPIWLLARNGKRGDGGWWEGCQLEITDQIKVGGPEEGGDNQPETADQRRLIRGEMCPARVKFV